MRRRALIDITGPVKTTQTRISNANSWVAKSSAITRSNLDLGPWELIFYGEFDGPAAANEFW
jgi:hypothetical protein